MTSRTEEGGRLFPAIEWDHGWLLSPQADRSGYRCSPQERLDRLEDYMTVEAKIDGPHGRVVDPRTMDMPAAVAEKFGELDTAGGACIGGHLTWDDVEAVKAAILMASMNPNAGVPRGVYGWSAATVYHGSSMEGAEDILENGIDVGRGDGYFGRAFYVAEEEELARSNYADFSGCDDGGAVVAFNVAEGARILDLRNAEDDDEWMRSGLPGLLGNRSFDAEARRRGIDGVYDRSVGGLAIYNPRILSEPSLCTPKEVVLPPKTLGR